MKKSVLMIILILMFCQSCQSNDNSPENQNLTTEVPSRQYSQLEINNKLKILDYYIPDLWEVRVLGDHEVAVDLVFTIPDTHSSVHYSQINYTNPGNAKDHLEGRIASLEMGLSDPSQVKSGTVIRTTRDICGNEAEVYEMIVYPSVEFEIEEETNNVYVFFLLDSYYIYFGMGLDMRDIDQHELYEAQFWEMIESIECPAIEK